MVRFEQTLNLSGRSKGKVTVATRGDITRGLLVQAALDVLRDRGYAGTSARTVAARAGVQQGLVFYHFGSMGALMIAALDEVSRQRAELFEPMLAGVHDLTSLIELGEVIVQHDIEAGYATIALELLAGTRADPELSAQVAQRLGAWQDFASRALTTGLGKTADSLPLDRATLAQALVAQYLGMELLALVGADTSAPGSDAETGTGGAAAALAELRRSAPFIERFVFPLLRRVRRSPS